MAPAQPWKVLRKAGGDTALGCPQPPPSPLQCHLWGCFDGTFGGRRGGFLRPGGTGGKVRHGGGTPHGDGGLGGMAGTTVSPGEVALLVCIPCRSHIILLTIPVCIPILVSDWLLTGPSPYCLLVPVCTPSSSQPIFPSLFQSLFPSGPSAYSLTDPSLHSLMVPVPVSIPLLVPGLVPLPVPVGPCWSQSALPTAPTQSLFSLRSFAGPTLRSLLLSVPSLLPARSRDPGPPPGRPRRSQALTWRQEGEEDEEGSEAERGRGQERELGESPHGRRAVRGSPVMGSAVSGAVMGSAAGIGRDGSGCNGIGCWDQL